MDECFEKLGLSDIVLLKSAGQKDVYKGTSESFGEIVIKIIRPGQNAERIEREIEIIERLNEINTSIIFEHGSVTCSKGTFKYILEPFIEGMCLKDYLDLSGSLDYPEVVKFLKQMLEIIEILEENQIIHRDIKPDNIIRKPDGTYYLIDFGIARDLDKVSLTATGAPNGPATYAYAPMEQIDNEKPNIDSRTDLYSTSLIAYEMINGGNPYYSIGDGVPQIIRKVEKGEFSPLTSSDFEDINEFIHTCMNKYIGRRPESASYANEWFNQII
ncbi:MAG: protein kinase [Halarcobacter sp.]